MPVTFQPDPSLAGYNSFVSLEEADDYHEMRLHNTDWTGATVETKQKALMWATNLLNNLKWKGLLASATQPLQWPRQNLSYYEEDDFGQVIYVEVSSTEPPIEIKMGTAELALYLIGNDETAPTGLEGFKEIKVDVISMKIDDINLPDWKKESVMQLVAKWLSNTDGNNVFNIPNLRVG